MDLTQELSFGASTRKFKFSPESETLIAGEFSKFPNRAHSHRATSADGDDLDVEDGEGDQVGSSLFDSANETYDQVIDKQGRSAVV